MVPSGYLCGHYQVFHSNTLGSSGPHGWLSKADFETGLFHYTPAYAVPFDIAGYWFSNGAQAEAHAVLAVLGLARWVIVVWRNEALLVSTWGAAVVNCMLLAIGLLCATGVSSAAALNAALSAMFAILPPAMLRSARRS